MTKQYYLLGIVAALVFVTAVSLMPPSPLFAQQDNATQLNTTSTDVPVLEQVSEKGIYRVQLKWPQTVTDVENALQVEIVFNNASAPMPTSTTIPQREGNATGSGTEAGLTVPETLGGEPIGCRKLRHGNIILRMAENYGRSLTSRGKEEEQRRGSILIVTILGQSL